MEGSTYRNLVQERGRIVEPRWIEDKGFRVKHFRDMVDIVKDKNINEIINGDMSDKNVTKVLSFFKRLYVDEIDFPKEINFLNFRLTKQKIWNKMVSESPCFNIDTEKSFSRLEGRNCSSDKYPLWHMLSNKVMCKESINFPIIYYYKNNCLFFESFTSELYDLSLVKYFNEHMSNQIIFQKLLILFTLYTNGISSLDYKFDTVKIHKTPIIFQVNKLQFKFDVEYIIILKNSTDLINIPDLEITYINALNIDSTDFISAFICLFKKYLNLSIFAMQSNFNVFSEKVKEVAKGDVVILKNNNSSFVSIITEVMNEVCELFIIHTVNKTTNGMTIKQNVDNLYKVDNIFNINEEILFIGKRGCC